MELTAKRPIYVKGAVLLEGRSFQTDEQHGRQLLAKGYATAPQAQKVDAQKDDPKSAKPVRAKSDEAK